MNRFLLLASAAMIVGLSTYDVSGAGTDVSPPAKSTSDSGGNAPENSTVNLPTMVTPNSADAPQGGETAGSSETTMADTKTSTDAPTDKGSAEEGGRKSKKRKSSLVMGTQPPAKKPKVDDKQGGLTPNPLFDATIPTDLNEQPTTYADPEDKGGEKERRNARVPARGDMKGLLPPSDFMRRGSVPALSTTTTPPQSGRARAKSVPAVMHAITPTQMSELEQKAELVKKGAGPRRGAINGVTFTDEQKAQLIIEDLKAQGAGLKWSKLLGTRAFNAKDCEYSKAESIDAVRDCATTFFRWVKYFPDDSKEVGINGSSDKEFAYKKFDYYNGWFSRKYLGSITRAEGSFSIKSMKSSERLGDYQDTVKQAFIDVFQYGRLIPYPEGPVKTAHTIQQNFNSEDMDIINKHFKHLVDAWNDKVKFQKLMKEELNNYKSIGDVNSNMTRILFKMRELQSKNASIPSSGNGVSAIMPAPSPKGLLMNEESPSLQNLKRYTIEKISYTNADKIGVINGDTVTNQVLIFNNKEKRKFNFYMGLILIGEKFDRILTDEKMLHQAQEDILKISQTELDDAAKDKARSMAAPAFVLNGRNKLVKD